MPLLHLLALAQLAQSPTSPPHEWDLVREYAVRERADGSLYVADELLIGMSATAERARLFDELDARGATIVGELPYLSVIRVVLPTDEDPARVADRYARIPGVLYAEPNDVGEGGWMGSTTDTS